MSTKISTPRLYVKVPVHTPPNHFVWFFLTTLFGELDLKAYFCSIQTTKMKLYPASRA